ncbi:amidase domain-containing protein [Hathewaya massiliensis]|uniref:amidase domain-containing protein n=1 Tax=Hathewaya massiliensis TaxID=1964382 RepID=UPI00115A1A5D|nr:amidase domain-containing protein [Hathewaya massiliensis]
MDKVINEEKESIVFMLEKYLKKRYEALSNLKSETYDEFFYRDINSLSSCKVNELVLDTLVQYRRDFPLETFLKDYDFKLTIRRIEKRDKIYKLVVREEFRYRYNSLSVDTKGIIEHYIKLINFNGDFKILSHSSRDPFIRKIQNTYYYALNKPYNIEEVREVLLYKCKMERDIIIDNLVDFNSDVQSNEFMVNHRERTRDLENINYSQYKNSISPIYRDMRDLYFLNYNRDNAVNYARKWALGRNPAYLDFEDLGGDCTNFVSQCVHAGGIPMDIERPHVWKYYGSQWNESSSRVGRSSSWTAVIYFRNYAKNNIKGSGLRAEVGADLKTLLPGDIIQIEDFHGTVILENVYRNGNLVDFLIACHTSDRLNERLLLEWPNSSYSKTGIKIKGAYSY